MPLVPFLPIFGILTFATRERLGNEPRETCNNLKRMAVLLMGVTFDPAHSP